MTSQARPEGELGVSYRLAEVADGARIAEVRLRAFEALHREHLRKPMSDDRRRVVQTLGLTMESGLTVVCISISHVIGAVTLLPPAQPGSEAWRRDGADLRLLAVEPAEQRRGIATQIIQEAEQLALACGARAVCLRVRQELAHIQSFYIKQGYRPDQLGDAVLPSGVQLVGLVKELDGHVEAG